MSQPASVTPLPPIDNPAIPEDKLREILIDACIDEAEAEAERPVGLLEPLRHFPHLWSFVEWYEPNREKFSEAQRTPLDTLIQTRDMVNSGCGCKRASREAAANDYFKSFWLNNQSNDLIPSVLKHVGSERVQFANFLTYPP